MFAVIYKFKLKPSQEELYQLHWQKIASYFIESRGAIGSMAVSVIVSAGI